MPRLPSDCPFESIAETYGTPIHVLDLRVLRDNASSFSRALGSAFPSATPLYSVKTNYLPTIVEELKACGYGVDVVSGYELELALRLKVPTSRVVFNGPHKTFDELRSAAASKILVNLDSLGEAHTLNSIASSMGATARVGLRVNPGISVYGSPDPSFNIMADRSVRESKFGYSVQDGSALAALREIAGMSHLNLCGLHCHLGAQITSMSLLRDAYRSFLAFAKAATQIAPINILDIGGGFGAPGIIRKRIGPLYQLLEMHGNPQVAVDDVLDVSECLRTLREDVDDANLSQMTIYTEPGRYIISSAMVLLTRVGSIKRTGGIDWVVIDAGLNLLPTIAMHDRHQIDSLRHPPGEMKQFRVGGPLCYERDVLRAECLLPADIRAGELLSISDSGAYSVSHATNFIRPRAPVVAWDGSSSRLCWRRETFEDIFSFSVDPLPR